MHTPSDILKQQRALILRIIAAHHGLNPRVFGSVAHHTDTPRSDIDILVDVAPGTSLLSLGAMQFELQESVGIPVDLLTAGDLPERFRDTVLREARPL